ncbi:MAG: hypothetical protein FJ095_11315 [Deltaproteobacteria bacterium]|nr:hypothetical protein [Deltaproteobacteria bacterium]
MSSSKVPCLEDPFLVVEVERALAPYRELLSPTELAWAQEALVLEVLEDAELRRLVAAAHPRAVDASGERVMHWLEALVATPREETG